MTPLEQLLAASLDPVQQPQVHALQAYLRALQARRAGDGTVDAAITRLCEGNALADDEGERLFRSLLSGRLGAEQAAAFLFLLRPEAASASLLAALAGTMRQLATDRVQVVLAPGEVLVDTCGTGSDGLGTFNVSTTIAFVLAAAGVKVAKHGNHAITSRCGSADVLAALDVRVDLDAAQVAECIRQVGIGFLHAPAFHQALRNVQPIRHALAQEMPPALRARTVLNVLGPLANPAQAPRQLVGVYDARLVPKIAEALRLLGVERALVVHGGCDGRPQGLDELSTAGVSQVAELRGGRIVERAVTPEEAGMTRVADPASFAGGAPAENAAILRRVLENAETPARMDLAVLNAAAGLYVADVAPSIAAGVERARQTIASGAALAKLDALRRTTNRLRA